MSAVDPKDTAPAERVEATLDELMAEDEFIDLFDGLDLGAFASHYEDSGGMPVDLALHVAAQMLRGLAHAHDTARQDGQVLVHRDVSPGNVLLSKVGEVKVADFGVATVGRGAEASHAVVGKASYMAPEQYRGEAVDARADVYAVGVVLFRILSGAMPFAMSDYRDDVGVAIQQIVERALAASPDDRFESARAMATAIAQLTEQGERVATADDLADAVAEVCAARKNTAKPVVLLARDGGGGVELTRSDGGEFTMQLSAIDLSAPSVIRTGYDIEQAGERHGLSTACRALACRPDADGAVESASTATAAARRDTIIFNRGGTR